MAATASRRIRGLRAIVGLAAGAVLFGFLGKWWWVPDLLANYRPHFGALLLLIGLAALPVDRDTALAGLLAAGVGLAALLPLHMSFSPTPVAGSPTIEVVAFNVGVSNPNRAAVAAWLSAEAPDVVFLFESSFEWEAAIRQADLPLSIVSIVPRGRVAGVTVLASPRLSPTAIELGSRAEVAALSIVVEGQRVELLGVHPPSPTSHSRSSRRDTILREAAEWIHGRSSPVVLAGDLNVTPWSAAYRSLRWRSGLVDSLHGSGYQWSWPEGWWPLSIPIDHVLHSRDLASSDRRTGPSFGSAHRPVVVSIGFAA